MACYKTFLLTMCSLISCMSAWDRSKFRGLFEKVPNMHLLTTNSPPHDNVDLEQCAKLCAKEVAFDCKSFDYIVLMRRCLLHSLGEGDPAETLEYDPKFDHISRGGSLLTKLPDTRLYSVALGYRSLSYKNVTVEKCTELCVKLRAFTCQSFDIAHDGSTCILHSGTIRHPTERLVKFPGTDHYKTAYHRLFRQLPFHTISVPYNHRHDYVASLEECARRCILEVKFKCRSMVYKERSGNCLLSEHSSHTDAGAQKLIALPDDKNYYERVPEGPLASFINFGLGNIMSHSPGNTFIVQSPVECARKCLHVGPTECQSFDYQTGRKFCFLSKYTAGTLRGMALAQEKQTFHYELIGKNMAYFYTTPFAIIPLNNLRTYSGVTPDECSRYCMEEAAFVCRSFDYRVMDSSCLLSEMTGSDVGGLYRQPLVQLHYFEMKPILDCGGVSREPKGDFASLNWPRDYESNINCTWTIKAPRNKIIKLRFPHFDVVSESSCSQNGDRLEVTEITESGTRRRSAPECLPSGTKEWISQKNAINVTFITDDRLSAQGFRAFYSMEWPCNGTAFTEKSGEFASPNWPEKYPRNTRCNYVIAAPVGHIVRLNFTHFDVDAPISGTCTTSGDRVTVYDGADSFSPVIGHYCDVYKSPLVIQSSHNVISIQFWSDKDIVRSGFHAKYEILKKSRSSSTMPPGGAYGLTTLNGKKLRGRTLEGKSENYTMQMATGAPNVSVSSLANSTGNIEDEEEDIFEYIVKKQTALAGAIVLAVFVLAGLLTAAVVIFRRTKRSECQNERGYLLHDNSSVGRVSSVDLTEGQTIEPHYESVDEHTLFIYTTGVSQNPTGALQNPTYDRTSPELPPRPKPDVVS